MSARARLRGAFSRWLDPPVPECGGVEEEALVLREVREQNGFAGHAATWGAGAVFFAMVNAISGGEEPWFIMPVAGWGIAIVSHGVAAFFTGPAKLAERRKALARAREREALAAPAAAPAPAPHAGEGGAVAELRTRLIGAAEEARRALRTVSPQAAADVSRGESRALEMVAWLDDADRIVARQGRDRSLRREVARKVSDPVYRSAREPLQRLLEKLDREDREIASLELALADRRQRLDSFLLALDGVRLARASGLALPAVSAPFSERVALLEAASRPESAAGGDRDRIAEEIRLARELQQSILPARAPEVRGLAVAHVYRPSSEVGGDFYDFYPLGEGRLLVALGDASGHGIDSSMVSSMCKSALYMQVSGGRAPQDALAEINRMMCDTLARRRLMTMLLLDVDAASGTVRMVNAGQIFPLHVRSSGEVVELEQPGYPMGVRRDAVYPVVQARLEPGDRLVLLTDGFVEAQSPSGEAFGWERLRRHLASAPGLAPDQLLASLVTELSRHLGASPPQDDVTIVVVGVLA